MATCDNRFTFFCGHTNYFRLTFSFTKLITTPNKSLNDFKENLKNLPFEQFKGMGTKLTTGIDEARKTFEFESMTQDDRDRLGIFTNKVFFLINIHFDIFARPKKC